MSLGSTPHGNTTDRENYEEDILNEREKLAFETDFNEMNQEMEEMLE